MAGRRRKAGSARQRPPLGDAQTELTTVMLPAGTLLCLLLQLLSVAAEWDDWWTYKDGVSGPDSWGNFFPDWKICKEGRRQSPINIEPRRLLFDTHLRSVHVDKHRIHGTLRNTGHDVTFTVDPSRTANISGGPLSYPYTFERFQLHFGLVPDGWQRSPTLQVAGSEHVISGQRFPAEIQLLGYNSHLYRNFSVAADQSHGVVGIAILIQVNIDAAIPNQELRSITDAMKQTTYQGEKTVLKGISLAELIPNTEQYITYEGSLTSPACQETVTWIVFNKPIYMSHHQLPMLQQLKQQSKDGIDQVSLGNNYRPVQNLNHRVVRTNIDFKPKDGRICPPMKHDTRYKASKWFGV